MHIYVLDTGERSARIPLSQLAETDGQPLYCSDDADQDAPAQKRAMRSGQQRPHAREGARTGRRRRDARPRGRGGARRQGAGAPQHRRCPARAGLVRLLGLGAHQRARHALVLPGHRRRDRAGRRARGRNRDSQGERRGRRPPRRDAADSDRRGDAARAPGRPRRADRDGDRHGQRRRDRHRLPGADGGDDLRGRRLRGVDPEPHRLDRRGRPQLRRAHRFGRACG